MGEGEVRCVQMDTDKKKKFKSPHLDKKWLENEYSNKKKSVCQIADELGRNPKTIYEKIRDFKIQTRPRGYNFIGDSPDNYTNQPDRKSGFAGKKHSDEVKKIISKRTLQVQPWLYVVRGEKREESKMNKIKKIEEAKKWKKIFRQVLERDEYRCCYCGKHEQIKDLRAFYIPTDATDEQILDASNYETLCLDHYIEKKLEKGIIADESKINECSVSVKKKKKKRKKREFVYNTKTDEFSPKNESTKDEEQKDEFLSALQIKDMTSPLFSFFPLATQEKFTELACHKESIYTLNDVTYQLSYLGAYYDGNVTDDAMLCSFAMLVHEKLHRLTFLKRFGPIIKLGPIPKNGKYLMLMYAFIKEYPNGARSGDVQAEIIGIEKEKRMDTVL